MTECGFHVERSIRTTGGSGTKRQTLFNRVTHTHTLSLQDRGPLGQLGAPGLPTVCAAVGTGRRSEAPGVRAVNPTHFQQKSVPE